MGMRFVPSANFYFKKLFFIFIITLLFVLLFVQTPVGRFFYYRTKLTNYSANLAVFRGVMKRPSLEDMLCVDLSYLIFRICLTLSKALMVCMAKDLLAHTAAMAVGVINRKVIYVSHFIHRMLFLNDRLTLSRVDGALNGHRKSEFCIKCVFVNNRHDGMIVYGLMQPHEFYLAL